MEKKQIGTVMHYYGKIGVAVVKLDSEIKVGDNICIEGHGKSFAQKVSSMQSEHKPINEAKAGEMVGLKVDQPVKEGDVIFRVEE